MFLFWTLSYESVGSRLSGRTRGPVSGGNSVGWYLEQRKPKSAAQSMQFAFKKSSHERVSLTVVQQNHGSAFCLLD